MTDLAELLERVKAATGRDRALDGQIEAAVRGVEAARVGLSPEQRAKWLAGPCGQVGDGYTEYSAQRFTASLDAALALVERVLPEMEFSISTAHHRKGWAVKTWLTDDKYSGRLFDAVTPALALLAALLSTLIAQPTSTAVGSVYPQNPSRNDQA